MLFYEYEYGIKHAETQRQLILADFQRAAIIFLTICLMSTKEYVRKSAKIKSWKLKFHRMGT